MPDSGPHRVAVMPILLLTGLALISGAGVARAAGVQSGGPDSRAGRLQEMCAHCHELTEAPPSQPARPAWQPSLGPPVDFIPAPGPRAEAAVGAVDHGARSLECLACHGAVSVQFPGGAAAGHPNVACTSCHDPHSRNRMLLRTNDDPGGLCGACHAR